MAFNPASYVEFVERVAALSFDNLDDPVICREQLLEIIAEAKLIDGECARGAFNTE